jgi:hypothetical protein
MGCRDRSIQGQQIKARTAAAEEGQPAGHSPLRVDKLATTAMESSRLYCGAIMIEQGEHERVLT